MSKRPFLLIAALILVAVALWLPSVQAFLRDSIIVPLLGVFWFMKIVFESIPQAFVWGFVVLLALVAAFGGLAAPGLLYNRGNMDRVPVRALWCPYLTRRI